MSYRYDPELAPDVPLLPTLDVSDVTAARAAIADLRKAQSPFVPPAGVSITSRVARARGNQLSVDVVVISPLATGPFPGMIYLHGGGFVLGSVMDDLAGPVALCAATNTVVVSVDYRLAPEHPSPAGLDDAYAALIWVRDNADELNIDASRLAVGGVSAGACLGAGLTHLVRERQGPTLIFQLLDIPVLDDRLETASMAAFTDTPLWNRNNAEASWRHYLGGADGPASESIAPARAIDLTGLPPAFIAVCEFDPLRDEGLDYARRLMLAGVSTELHVYPGTFHGSRSSFPNAAISRRMTSDLENALSRALAPSPGTGSWT